MSVGVVLSLLSLSLCSISAFQWFGHRRSPAPFRQNQNRNIKGTLTRPQLNHGGLGMVIKEGNSSNIDNQKYTPHLSTNGLKDGEPTHSMSQTSRLSHAMLKVPRVDETVRFWQAQGGTVLKSSLDDRHAYKSAFVALGNGTSTKDTFALELVPYEAPGFHVGNVVSYLGVSLLLQFRDNLLGAVKGEKPSNAGMSKTLSWDDEPNGIAIQSAASAPGDYFCRLALKSNDLEASRDFYTNLLGMQVKAADETMLCLRYEPSNADGLSRQGGVPTTLVLEYTKEPLNHGNCLDHVAIRTRANVEDEYRRLQQAFVKGEIDSKVYLKPTQMFGATVMGVKDPNGYRIVLASEV